MSSHAGGEDRTYMDELIGLGAFSLVEPSHPARVGVAVWKVTGQASESSQGGRPKSGRSWGGRVTERQSLVAISD